MMPGELVFPTKNAPGLRSNCYLEQNQQTYQGCQDISDTGQLLVQLDKKKSGLIAEKSPKQESMLDHNHKRVAWDKTLSQTLFI